MTVRRVRTAELPAAPAVVIEALRRALDRPPPGYRCVLTVWKPNGAGVQTVLRPTNGLFLETPVTIEVHPGPSSSRSRVVARTQSQWFIIGDVFGFYGRYLDHFIAEIRRQIGTAAQGGAAPGAPTAARG